MMLIFIWLWLLIILALAVFLLVTAFYNIFLGAPFLSSNRETLDTLLNKIDLSGKKKLYELGSGNGKVISRIAQKYPQLECVGVEFNWAVYFLALGRNLFSKRKVKYLCQNMFKVDLRDADVVFTYLFPKPMERLEPKFAAELKPGAMVISSTFPLKNKQPAQVYRNKSCLATIYVYQY
ncbi:MAG: class I SAM-dependent methyltransferase [Patescibacteria group bacterium]